MPEHRWISKRSEAIDASGIRKVFDLAAKLKDPINLSIGQPDFDVPEIAKAAARRAIDSGENRYTQTQGIAPLRERLRADLSREFRRDVGDVLVTSGVSGGLMLAMLATLDPGDECIFLDPYFVMYKHLLSLGGAKAVIVPANADFTFPAERVERAITPRTRVLLLNSPSNPTGAVMSEAEVRAAVEIARRHNLLIVSDEIYEPFLYSETPGGRPGERSGVYSPAELDENVLVLRGFSKSHAMTGWRLGYAFGPPPVVNAMTRLQQYTYVCAPAPFQHGALAALDSPMHDAVAAYQRKRDLAFEILSKKFEVVRPRGAFYIFPRAPGGMSGSEFCARAIDNNVLVIPGNVFSEQDTHFRVSYATPDERLRKGCEILCAIADA